MLSVKIANFYLGDEVFVVVLKNAISMKQPYETIASILISASALYSIASYTNCFFQSP